MPLHVHPVLRAREEALETDGLIKTLNSVGLTRVSDAESAGKRVAKIVPKAFVLKIRGSAYTAT